MEIYGPLLPSITGPGHPRLRCRQRTLDLQHTPRLPVACHCLSRSSAPSTPSTVPGSSASATPSTGLRGRPCPRLSSTDLQSTTYPAHSRIRRSVRSVPHLLRLPRHSLSEPTFLAPHRWPTAFCAFSTFFVFGMFNGLPASAWVCHGTVHTSKGFFMICFFLLFIAVHDPPSLTSTFRDHPLATRQSDPSVTSREAQSFHALRSSSAPSLALQSPPCRPCLGYGFNSCVILRARPVLCILRDGTVFDQRHCLATACLSAPPCSPRSASAPSSTPS